MKRVFVGILNNWPYLHSYFVKSLMEIVMHCHKVMGETQIQVDFDFCWGAYVDAMRNEAVNRCMKGQYDYLIMFDADMVYPKDVVQRLIAHDKDVVNGVYYWKVLKQTKEGPKAYAPHVYLKRKQDMFDEGTDMHRYDPIDINRIEQDLVEVDALGGGGMCIKRHVLEKIGPPYFSCQWEDSSWISGEDMRFCKSAKDNGFKVWCDLTLQFGHLTQGAIYEKNLLNTDTFMRQFLSRQNKDHEANHEVKIVDRMLDDIKTGNYEKIKMNITTKGDEKDVKSKNS